MVVDLISWAQAAGAGDGGYFPQLGRGGVHYLS